MATRVRTSRSAELRRRAIVDRLYIILGAHVDEEVGMRDVLEHAQFSQKVAVHGLLLPVLLLDGHQIPKVSSDVYLAAWEPECRRQYFST
eukprot:scaffold1572_cov272-Pinguiococcus_pyrenoidosus.AAC.1